MGTAYKIYASILNERLEKEATDKLKKGQFGFKKERGTNMIYMLNYVVNRELNRKEGKIFAFFTAAFDVVDRRKLNELMKKMKIEKNLKLRIMDKYV